MVPTILVEHGFAQVPIYGTHGFVCLESYKIVVR